MTVDEKVKVLSDIFAITDVIPKDMKDQVAGMIIGFVMASQLKETKGA